MAYIVKMVIKQPVIGKYEEMKNERVKEQIMKFEEIFGAPEDKEVKKPRKKGAYCCKKIIP